MLPIYVARMGSDFWYRVAVIGAGVLSVVLAVAIVLMT
jgi:hypothetical protein